MIENLELTRYEYLKEKLKTKEKYYFIDKERSFDILSKEVFLKRNEIIHYPFNREGKNKYKFNKIIYKNMPKKLPSGIIKSANLGYGFTKEVY